MRILLTMSLCVCFLQSLLAAEIAIALDKADGLYELNEQINWTIRIKDAQAGAANYRLLRGGIELISEGAIDLSQAEHQVHCAVDKPASLFMEVTYQPAQGKKVTKQAGALVAAPQIQPSMPVPEDFDTFWSEKIAQQAAIPINAQLEAEQSPEAGVELQLIKMDTINGQHIHGRLAKPVGDNKLPALLIVQWAGVYGLHPYWSIGQAKRGFLTLNILAHDLPVNKDKAFYNEQKKGALKGYTKIGNDNRETSYFLRMFLSCVRGVEYLKQHPQWNGEVLMVTGGSQGGYQAFVTAGLCPEITGVVVNVPAGCDHTALAANRALGWPFWLAGDDKNEGKIQASRYYDGVNFASRITCPVLVGFGLGDPVSRSEGIMAAINQMQGPVEMAITPDANHGGPHRAYKPRAEAWFNAAVKGEALPVKAYK